MDIRYYFPGALSTNPFFNKFWIPEGSKFFVYNKDTKQYIGAITSEFISGDRENPENFSTSLIFGEKISFEYYEPAGTEMDAIIELSRIDYGYRYVNDPEFYSLFGIGDSGSCQVNVNCSEGSNWQAEKDAIALMMVSNNYGTGWCTCALINNTRLDDTPYILTANHCVEGYDALGNNNLGDFHFHWKYESSGCSNSHPQYSATTRGAQLIANNSVSDFALLKLHQNPTSIIGFEPYYLGWTRSETPGTGGVGIHHPRGDIKKYQLIIKFPQILIA